MKDEETSEKAKKENSPKKSVDRKKKAGEFGSQAARMAGDAGKKIASAARKAGVFLTEKGKDGIYAVQDGISELKIRHIKAVKKRERLKKSLSPEKYQEYRKKELMRQAVIGGIGIVGVVLCILLLTGLVRLIGFVGSQLFEKNEPVTEVVAEIETETEKVYPEKTITIGSTGSMLLHSPFIDSYPDAEGNYDFSSIYTYIRNYYSEPDFMTCEFEGALGGPELGYSGYPSFKAPDVIIENLRDAGIDLQMLACNHIYDGWAGAFERTMDVYAQKGISYTGIRPDKNDKQYYIANIDGVEVGFINYTYETTSQTEALGYGSGKSINGLVMETADAERLNSFDYEKLPEFYAELKDNIRKMKNEGARFIIAQMHWGTEYQLQESDIQRQMAQEMCNLGVDALIGGHPHCEQPIDVFSTADGSHDMFCIFSEGNALSNQRTYLMQAEMPNGHTEDGVMITLTLHQDTAGDVVITDVNMLPTWVYRYEDNGSKYFIFPLDDVKNLEENTGISGIEAEAQASYDRTLEVLGAGYDKAKKFFAKNVVVEPQTEEMSDTSETETEA